MTEDIRDFLRRFPADDLENRGILIPDKSYTYLLRAPTVNPLIVLMQEQGITRLEARDLNWFLTADRQFRNPKSDEGKEGCVDELSNRGNVFNWQNRSLNPFFKQTKPYSVFGRIIEPEQ